MWGTFYAWVINSKSMLREGHVGTGSIIWPDTVSNMFAKSLVYVKGFKTGSDLAKTGCQKKIQYTGK